GPGRARCDSRSSQPLSGACTGCDRKRAAGPMRPVFDTNHGGARPTRLRATYTEARAEAVV
ncbi:MAG: hypothetical protein P8R45_00220, partial [Candidatus Binatia bacterium]|nr:hypothetical protein [Candidatus Binatia bacterium]